MAIQLKNADQIDRMRTAGGIVASCHSYIKSLVKPGVTTKELDAAAEEFILSRGAVPSFLGYRGFPASICASVNDEVIHGVPGPRVLKQGDIISVDIGVYINGFHGDSSRTYAVGAVSPENEKLIAVARQSFFEGMRYARAGRHLHEISGAIQNFVEANGFSVVRDYVGHGIGQKLHESPEIPCYRPPSRGPRLCPGMALAIEPMVNAGTYEISLLHNNQTVVTADGMNSAHYENTIVITGGEPELLTITDEDI